MSIFAKIKSAIFGSAVAAPAPPVASPAPSPSTAPATPPSPATAAIEAAQPPVSPSPTPVATQTTAPVVPPAAPASQPHVDVAAILTGLASKHKERLDWRRSIVDLMKLLDLDSSLAARKDLAQELHYSGDTNDSATMNMWLHKQVMRKLAENGGKVPDDLKD